MLSVAQASWSGCFPVLAATSSSRDGGVESPKKDAGREGLSLSLAEHEALPSIAATKRVVLVRHGQSTWNAEGRIQGSSNFSVLTPKGESQAETSRQMLLAGTFDACFYSPLSRAMRTAEIIWSSRSKPMIAVDDLREIDLYAFQGLMKNEGKQRYGDAYRMWQKDASNFVIDGHYPVRELWLRGYKCWSTILTSEGTSLLVVAHNAVNQALVATAIGLGPEYFRQLLQSNCGVTVLDFTPRCSGDGPPFVCIDRLNQTPSSPIAAGQSGGRQSKRRVILVCQGTNDSTSQNCFPSSEREPINMLGVIQSRKTAELLLDTRAGFIFSSSDECCSLFTAAAIAEVQEAADRLGADSVPRSVESIKMKELNDMNWGSWQGMRKAEVASRERWQDYIQHEDVKGGESLESLWNRSSSAWDAITGSLTKLEGSTSDSIVVVAPEVVVVAMLCHCLGLSRSFLGSFRSDPAGVSVVDFPDGPCRRGAVRCTNYTAHLGRWAVPVTRSSPYESIEEF